VRFVPPRQYDQFCGLARALEVVGERWTLLVVRDLLDGPKRYGDLLEGLAPIATDVLAGRLRELEGAGLVTREPGRSYALTEDGLALVPSLDALSRWGLRRLERRPDDVVRPRWLGMAVRALVRRDRPGVDMVLRLDVPEGSAGLHITEAAVTDVVPPEGDAADVVLAGEAESLIAALDPGRLPDLLASGDLTVSGDASAVRTLATLFPAGGR
jgi:DNA-binding HxlR family transcriptional regulator